ncbi:hypothetical protein C1H46_035937 [Malus baccata]|uniref:Uncharacterized protein n=1 Tax=Malus baccata TaxID=106549 RepID=A0A540KWA3_MALBA|nr:hypothetical protein C1H46_035937 [Malus baccata]
MVVIDTNSDVSPTKSFLGRSLPKSFSWYRDVKMDRNMTMAVTEKQRATREAMAKMSKAGWFSRVGVPLSSLMPPGTVVEVAKATVAMRAATTEQDSEVLVNHSPPSLTIVVWVSVKICFAVLPFSLWRAKKCSGMEVFTNYKLGNKLFKIGNLIF